MVARLVTALAAYVIGLRQLQTGEGGGAFRGRGQDLGFAGLVSGYHEVVFPCQALNFYSWAFIHV